MTALVHDCGICNNSRIIIHEPLAKIVACSCPANLTVQQLPRTYISNVATAVARSAFYQPLWVIILTNLIFIANCCIAIQIDRWHLACVSIDSTVVSWCIQVQALEVILIVKVALSRGAYTESLICVCHHIWKWHFSATCSFDAVWV